MAWVMLKDLDMNQPEIVRLKNSVNERDHVVGPQVVTVGAPSKICVENLSKPISASLS